MRTHYKLLLISFILSLLAGILVIILYGSAIISLISNIEYATNGTPAATPPNP